MPPHVSDVDHDSTLSSISPEQPKFTLTNGPLKGGESRKATATVRPSDQDFIWSLIPEPHASRRKLILKAHPEIQQLFGPHWATKYVVISIVLTQVFLAYHLRDTPFFSWKFFLLAYFVGGTIHQALFLGIHEITHYLAFKSRTLNKALAIFTNLPICIGYSTLFKDYHMDHHRYQGVDGWDTDLPTPLEAKLLTGRFGKLFFMTFQIFFYAFRPTFIQPKALSKQLAINWAACLTFDFLMFHYGSLNSILYLLLSTFLAGSLHPCAAHFISEHYVFEGDAETYSYYGPLNWLCFNVGYHNEHHDFPNINWLNLPKLRKIAPEFYDVLPRHESWVKCMWDFLWRDDIGLYCRVKRQNKISSLVPKQPDWGDEKKE